ncbi:hypothetical protein [Burkholderia cepacia]|uniref:hypothetical protein n=1 Tax=Burkholderia cepacia TaxID=292 RepID=UPI001CF49490|nr:hypothetical protein [Burkholderia cepacia]MCA8114956.1 hypothetical protein [Burkholderia cepacia]MCA8401413.1 hypothetical protein [Burkholderia cepacia]
MSRDMTHQRVGAISNAHAGREFEASARRFFANRGIDLSQNLKVMVGISAQKKNHAFDLGCDERKIIVECKSHRWTSTSNIPSAKLTVWNEAMYYFSLAPTDYRKVMFVLRDECSKRGLTLATYYLKNYDHLIPPDVEFWEYDESAHDAVCVRFAATL